MLLIPLWSIYLLIHNRISPSEYSLDALCGLALLSLICAGAYVLNQIYDRESDSTNGKLGFFADSGRLTLNSGWIIYSLLTICPILAAFFMNPLLAPPLVVGAIIGYAYSAPPLSAKDRPLAGYIFNVIPYSVIAWWVVLVCSKDGFANFTARIGMDWPIILCAGFAVGGVYLITTVPDVAGDAKAGKRTAAVAIGVKKTMTLAILNLAASLGLAAFSGFHSFTAASALAIPLAVMAARPGGGRFVALSAKAPIIVVTLFAGFYHPIYGTFVILLIMASRTYYRVRFAEVYPQIG